MSFIAIILNLFLEYYKLIETPKKWFKELIQSYANLFMNKDFKSVRHIRVTFIVAMIPFAIVTIAMQILHFNHLSWLYIISNGILYILFVDVLGWKSEAKQTNRKNSYQSFIQSFATNFFATTLWFMLLPSVLGAICYLTLTAMGNQLRNQKDESIVYAMVVDKMLFWINSLPYLIMIIFIALAGDFEAVLHKLIEQRTKIKVSYLYLENLLNEIAYVAIGKDKFQHSKLNYIDDEGFERIERSNIYDTQIVDYIIALLYRTGIFFLTTLIALSIAEIL